MKLRYQTAVLSICPDLTDPDAASVPVAVLLLGDVGKVHRHAAAAVVEPLAQLDPFLTEHISDALAIIREQVDHFWQERPGATNREILMGLHEALRNSLHVSEIGDEQVVDVAGEVAQLLPKLGALAEEGLAQAIRAALGVAPLPPTSAAKMNQAQEIPPRELAAWRLQAIA